MPGKFNEAARLQTVLEKLPSIIQSTAPIFGAVAAPLGNIDKVVVIEQGNGNGQGQSGVSRFASTAPSVIFGLLQQLEALGLNVPNLLSQLGIDSKAMEVAHPVEAQSDRGEHARLRSGERDAE
jgi:flotillin